MRKSLRTRCAQMWYGCQRISQTSQSMTRPARIITTATPIQFFARNSNAVMRSELNSAQMAETSARTQLMSALNIESVNMPMMLLLHRPEGRWCKKSGRCRGRIRA